MRCSFIPRQIWETLQLNKSSWFVFLNFTLSWQPLPSWTRWDWWCVGDYLTCWHLKQFWFHTQAKIMGINSSPFFLGFYLMPITAMGHSVVFKIQNKNKSFYLYIWNISKYVYIFYIFIHTVYDLDTYGELMINSCTILGTDAFSTHAVTYKSQPQATRNGLNYNDRSMRWPCMESNISATRHLFMLPFRELNVPLEIVAEGHFTPTPSMDQMKIYRWGRSITHLKTCRCRL